MDTLTGCFELNTLFSVALLELFLGGGGRLLEVGPGTVRMIIFVLCLLASAAYALRRPQLSSGLGLPVALVALCMLTHTVALVQGTVRGSDLDSMWVEYQQSLFWLAAPFFAIVLKSKAMVYRAATLVRFSGATLAILYLTTIALLETGVIDYGSLYENLNSFPEFAFRSESFFFYKGFIYLGVAALFFTALRGPYSRAWAVVTFVAMALTLTRGFIFSALAATLIMLFVQRRWKAFAAILLIASVLAFMVWIYLPTLDETLDSSRTISDSQRLDDIAFVLDNLDVRTLFFGQGLGVLINDRVAIEMTFVWALWRLGLPGVIFWLLPIILCGVYYLRLDRASAEFDMASAFMFGVLLIYMETMTNPYLNNPIGLSFVMVALFSLRTLSARTRQPASAEAKRGAAAAQKLTPRIR